MTGLDNRPRRQPGRDRVVFCSARRTARPYSTSLLSSSLPLYLSSSLPLFLSSSLPLFLFLFLSPSPPSHPLSLSHSPSLPLPLSLPFFLSHSPALPASCTIPFRRQLQSSAEYVPDNRQIKPLPGQRTSIRPKKCKARTSNTSPTPRQIKPLPDQRTSARPQKAQNPHR